MLLLTRRGSSTAFLVLACGACTTVLGDFNVGPAASVSGDAGPDATAPRPPGDAATDVGMPADSGMPADVGMSDAPASQVPGAPSGVSAAAVPVVTTVTTLAGSTQGYGDGTGAAASFSGPVGVAVDGAGNVYVADAGNQRIRKVTAAGVVTTLAGSGNAGFADGTGAAASFAVPLGVAVDAAANVYVADGANNRIRKVTPAGVVTTLAGSGTGGFADGPGATASFQGPSGVAVDGNGNVYVADQTNQRIRFVSPTGDVSTVAGSGTASFADGTGAAASFDYPLGIAVDAGNVWVGDGGNNRIRKVSPAGVVMTLAGQSAANPFADGVGGAARFSSPQGIALDIADTAYVCDQGHHRIRMVSPLGSVTTLAGSGVAGFADGPAASAAFNSPAGIAVGPSHDVYVGDGNNNRIRKITSVGPGQLTVSWSPPSSPGSSAISGYAATAVAAGFAPQTCTTAGPTSCVLSGLSSGVGYSVSVTATNAAGTGAPSGSVIGTPN